MLSTHHPWYDLKFKLKIVAKAEAVNNNREIAHEYMAFQNSWWENDAISNIKPVFWWAADDSKVCILATL